MRSWFALSRIPRWLPLVRSDGASRPLDQGRQFGDVDIARVPGVTTRQLCPGARGDLGRFAIIAPFVHNRRSSLYFDKLHVSADPCGFLLQRFLECQQLSFHFRGGITLFVQDNVAMHAVAVCGFLVKEPRKEVSFNMLGKGQGAMQSAALVAVDVYHEENFIDL